MGSRVSVNLLKVSAKFFVPRPFFNKRVANQVSVPILEMRKPGLGTIKDLALNSSEMSHSCPE